MAYVASSRLAVPVTVLSDDRDDRDYGYHRSFIYPRGAEGGGGRGTVRSSKVAARASSRRGASRNDGRRGDKRTRDGEGGGR